MNTLCDQFQRCIRHPHQRIVGVCSSCLQERLISLIEPPSAPETETIRGYDTHELASNLTVNNHVTVDSHDSRHPEHTNPYAAHANLSRHVTNALTEIVPQKSAKAHTQERAIPCMHPSFASTTAPTEQQGDIQNFRTQSVRHGHHPSSDFVSGARYSNQNGHADKQDRSWHMDRQDKRADVLSLDKRNRGAHCQNRVSFMEGDKKKSGSWFSLSKSKSASHTTYAQTDDRNLPLKSPQNHAASRGRSLDACRHTHTPDLEAIAETNSSDVNGKIQSHVSREAGTSTSWISVLFHRKKWSRSRSNLSNNSSSSVPNAVSDTNGNDINSSEPGNRQNAIEAGRLSWDGARPNFKQLLRARSKPQSQTDFASPSQFIDYTMKEYHDNGREIAHQATSLQKSKSVASARSSISVEMPKDLMQSSFSPTIHQGQSNVMVGLEYDGFYDDRNLRRSRSWGRTWNRALSPLWGSRSHRHKVVTDIPSSTHQRDCLPVRTPAATPSHASLKSAATPASTSSRLSPLRRGKLAPTLKNLL